MVVSFSKLILLKWILNLIFYIEAIVEFHGFTQRRLTVEQKYNIIEDDLQKKTRRRYCVGKIINSGSLLRIKN